MKDKKSLSELSDRELLELILSNQVKIFRAIRYVEERINTGKQIGLGQYWKTFRKLTSDKEDVISQINRYLENKEEWDEKQPMDEKDEG